MPSEYAGLVPQWLENNKSYIKDVFPALPEPWHMAERRKLVTDKTSIVRKSTLYQIRSLLNELLM